MYRYKSEGALLLMTLIWGATFAIIKNALHDASPMVFISLRFTLAALILLPFVKKIFKQSNLAELKGGLILGVIYFIGFALQTIGLNFTTATKSGFITGTFVIFTPIFQIFIEKRMPTRANIIGTFLVVLGLIFLSSKGESLFNIFTEIGSGFNIGDFFTLLCAIFFALYIVCVDIISKKFNFMPLTFIQIAVTGIGGIISAAALGAFDLEPARFALTGNLFSAILYTSILATVLTTIIQTKYQKAVTPTKAGIIFSFEPIFAAAIAFFMLNETMSSFGVVGCLFIFAGLLVTELLDKSRE